MTASGRKIGSTLLKVDNISLSFGGVRALKEVTFTAYRGKVNVLVGENGAGKSTLMKILSGAEQPTSGEILLEGEPVVLGSPRDAALLHQRDEDWQQVQIVAHAVILSDVYLTLER